MILRFFAHIIFQFVRFPLVLAIYPIAYLYRIWSRTNKDKNSVAKLLWWFLDDTPEWSDAGGNRFYRNECLYENGIDDESYGSWEESGLSTEKNIYDKKRRFICSFMWSALRNQMVNFRDDVYNLKDKASNYRIIYDTRESDHKVTVKVEKGCIDLKSTLTGSYVSILTDTNGKNHLRIDSARLFKIRNRYIGWDMWIGYSIQKHHRYESTFRPYLFVKAL